MIQRQKNKWLNKSELLFCPCSRCSLGVKTPISRNSQKLYIYIFFFWGGANLLKPDLSTNCRFPKILPFSSCPRTKKQVDTFKLKLNPISLNRKKVTLFGRLLLMGVFFKCWRRCYWASIYSFIIGINNS